MSRQKLIKQLKKKNIQLNQLDLETVIDIFCDDISNAVLKGENVEIRNWGRFFTKRLKENFNRIILRIMILEHFYSENRDN